MVIAVALPALLISDIGGAGGGGGNGGVAAALAAIGEHELMEAPVPTTSEAGLRVPKSRQHRAVLHSRRRCQLLLLDDRRVSRGDLLVALGDCRRVIGGRRRVSGDRRNVLGDRRVALGDRRVALVGHIDRPRVHLLLVGEMDVFRRELSAESGNLGGAIGELRVALRYRRRLRRDRLVTLGDGCVALGGGVCDNTKVIM